MADSAEGLDANTQAAAKELLSPAALKTSRDERFNLATDKLMGEQIDQKQVARKKQVQSITVNERYDLVKSVSSVEHVPRLSKGANEMSGYSNNTELLKLRNSLYPEIAASEMMNINSKRFERSVRHLSTYMDGPLRKKVEKVLSDKNLDPDQKKSTIIALYQNNPELDKAIKQLSLDMPNIGGEWDRFVGNMSTSLSDIIDDTANYMKGVPHLFDKVHGGGFSATGATAGAVTAGGLSLLISEKWKGATFISMGIAGLVYSNPATAEAFSSVAVKVFEGTGAVVNSYAQGINNVANFVVHGIPSLLKNESGQAVARLEDVSAQYKDYPPALRKYWSRIQNEKTQKIPANFSDEELLDISKMVVSGAKDSMNSVEQALFGAQVKTGNIDDPLLKKYIFSSGIGGIHSYLMKNSKTRDTYKKTLSIAKNEGTNKYKNMLSQVSTKNYAGTYAKTRSFHTGLSADFSSGAGLLMKLFVMAYMAGWTALGVSKVAGKVTKKDSHGEITKKKNKRQFVGNLCVIAGNGNFDDTMKFLKTPYIGRGWGTSKSQGFLDSKEIRKLKKLPKTSQNEFMKEIVAKIKIDTKNPEEIRNDILGIVVPFKGKDKKGQKTATSSIKDILGLSTKENKPWRNNLITNRVNALSTFQIAIDQSKKDGDEVKSAKYIKTHIKKYLSALSIWGGKGFNIIDTFNTQDSKKDGDKDPKRYGTLRNSIKQILSDSKASLSGKSGDLDYDVAKKFKDDSENFMRKAMRRLSKDKN